MPKPELTIETLQDKAKRFSEIESKHDEPTLFGVTDGKAIGTYFEQKFQSLLHEKYNFEKGNSAKGIDFPILNIDMKVTSVNKPQSSCPFKSARQKIYGLGYSLLIFVYNKIDSSKMKTGTLKIQHTIFVESQSTGDFQTTLGLLQLLNNEANADDITAFLYERNLPIDEIQAESLTEEILKNPPQQGYLTISNALQWRLQYRRVIKEADNVSGVIKVQ